MSTVMSAISASPTARTGRWRQWLDATYLGAGALGAASVLAIAVLMIWQTVMRLAGHSTGAANDIVAWLAAAAAFLTMAHAFKHGDFVRVTVLLDRLSAPWRRRFEMASLALGIVATGYLAWWACAATYESWLFHDIAQGLLPLPMWIPQSSFAAGAMLLLVAVLDELVLVCRGEEPTYARLARERHAAGDYSSDI
ncbi:TRAP transporter small permease [Piscinibacter sp. HJYY11]|uniref:TRAP transporter small permease n=1 Tax=Piscinibacter sp. HJYY11 TaxID=2801333 RepID=UPI001F32AB24|nr:TRAP transporter small permease [Piscinibacter sp. HJYY11]